MSDQSKHLLNEAQVRKFMKLASLEPLTAGFVKGLTVTETHGRGYNDGPEYEGRRRVREAEAPPGELEDYAAGDLERGHPGEAEADELEAADELGAEDAGDAAPEERMISIDDFLSALESTLEAVLGDEVEIDSDDLGDEEEELEVDAELGPGGEEVDVDVEDEEMLEETGADDTGASAGDESKTDRGEEDYTTKKGMKKKTSSPGRGEKKGDEAYVNEELVEQITRRVAARILKSALGSKKKSNVNEGLGDLGREAWRGAKKALGVSSEQKIRTQLAPKVAQILAKAFKMGNIPVDAAKMVDLWSGAYPGEEGGAANGVQSYTTMEYGGSDAKEIAMNVAMMGFASNDVVEEMGITDDDVAGQYYQAITAVCEKLGVCAEGSGEEEKQRRAAYAAEKAGPEWAAREAAMNTPEKMAARVAARRERGG